MYTQYYAGILRKVCEIAFENVIAAVNSSVCTSFPSFFTITFCHHHPFSARSSSACNRTYGVVAVHRIFVKMQNACEESTMKMVCEESKQRFEKCDLNFVQFTQYEHENLYAFMPWIDRVVNLRICVEWRTVLYDKPNL